MNAYLNLFTKIGKKSNTFRHFSKNTFSINSSKYNEGYPTREDSDIYKRDTVKSDNDPEKFNKKFNKKEKKHKYDVENEKWTANQPYMGKILFYPKYGTSNYEPQEYKL